MLFRIFAFFHYFLHGSQFKKAARKNKKKLKKLLLLLRKRKLHIQLSQQLEQKKRSQKLQQNEHKQREGKKRSKKKSCTRKLSFNRIRPFKTNRFKGRHHSKDNLRRQQRSLKRMKLEYRLKQSGLDLWAFRVRQKC